MVLGANGGQAVSVVTWFLLVTSFLATVARIAAKWTVAREFGRDDVIIVGALVCTPPSLLQIACLRRSMIVDSIFQLSNIASGVAVSFASSKGLGIASTNLLPDAIEAQLKVRQASSMGGTRQGSGHSTQSAGHT